jgi:hypothetical protein
VFLVKKIKRVEKEFLGGKNMNVGFSATTMDEI